METRGRGALRTVISLRGALMALGAVAVIGGASPAYAEEPDAAGSGTAFLADLQSAGLTFVSSDQAIAVGHAVCSMIDSGESGLQVVKQVKADNPELSMDGAAQFAALAAKSYCPQQLTK